jgi:hypothetical protein
MVAAPEAVTDRADVWSLGVVLWELVAARAPWAEVPPARLVAALGAGGARLPIPAWCEPAWRALIEACWLREPGLRPSAAALAAQLERVRDAAPRE